MPQKLVGQGVSMALVDGAAAPLPTKDFAVYRSTHKLYEHRQYKRGLKVCEQLLKKHSNHAETMAMRALFLAHTGRNSDAHVQARDALKAGVKSIVCWHVYGLIHRLERNYPEALKAYRMALRLETLPGNSSLLRDVAALQTQLRLYSALVETRLSAVTLRPTMRMHWISLAVAYDLAGAPSSAADLVKVVRHNFPIEEYVPVDEYSSALVEEGELQLYLADCLFRARRLDDALDALSAKSFGHAHAIDLYSSSEYVRRRARLPVDPFGVLLMRARILLHRNIPGDVQEARAIGLRLFESNSDSEDALRVVLASIPAGDHGLMHSIVQDMHCAHPNSLLLRSYVLRTSSVKDLPVNLEKVTEQLIGSCAGSIAGFIISAEIHSLVGGDIADRRAAVEAFCFSRADSDCPMTHLMLAQYWMYRGDFEKSVKHHESALDDSKTRNDAIVSYASLVDAMIWKGFTISPSTAYLALDHVRQLDPSDRYTNTMCVRYALRAGFVRQAKEIAALFLRAKLLKKPAPPAAVASGFHSHDQTENRPDNLKAAECDSMTGRCDEAASTHETINGCTTAADGPKIDVSSGATVSGSEPDGEKCELQGSDQRDVEGSAVDELQNDEDGECNKLTPAGPSCTALEASPSVELQIADFTDMQAAWFLLELGHAQYCYAMYGSSNAAHSTCKIASDLSSILHCNETNFCKDISHGFDAPIVALEKEVVIHDFSALYAAMHSFATVIRHHSDFYDDQFDFHNYSLRRLTLTSYVSGLLEWEDTKVFLSPWYFAAAVGYLVCKRVFDTKSSLDISALKLQDSVIPCKDAYLDELLIADRLVANYPQSRTAHSLAFDIWMRRGCPVNARVIRSLYLATTPGYEPVPGGAECSVVHLACESEHITCPRSGAVITPVLPAPSMRVDLSAVRKRVELYNGNADIRSALHRALSRVSDLPVRQETVRQSPATPTLDRILSAYSR